MKNEYCSTFIPGLEDMVAQAMRRTGGVSVEQIGRGYCVYRSVKEPQLPFMHRSFLLLSRLRREKDVDTALRRIQSDDSWMDRLPFEQAAGKTFRLTAHENGTPVSASMKTVHLIENRICEQTGMRVHRDRPAVEIWVDLREDATLLLWYSAHRREKESDLLRRDLCELMAACMSVSGRNAAVIGCTGENLPRALKAAGARKVTCAFYDRGARERMQRSGEDRLVILPGPLSDTGIPDGGMQAVFFLVPTKSEERLDESDVRGGFRESLRILENGGLMMILLPRRLREESRRRLGSCRRVWQHTLLLGGEAYELSLLERDTEESGRE